MTPERLTPDREVQLRKAANWREDDCERLLFREIDALRSQVDVLAGALKLLSRFHEDCYCDDPEDPTIDSRIMCNHCTINAALSNPAIAQRLADAEELRAAIEPFVQGHEQMQRDPQDTPDTRVLYHKGITLGVIARLAAARDRMWGSK